MKGLETMTGQSMQNRLYPFFWQHGETHEVLGEYMERIAGCGMKGVCIEARPHPEFVQDGWWKDLDYIISRAKELDMKLWILDDSHFPTGFANGKIKGKYPQYRKWYLDMRRFDVQGPMIGARINLKLLKGRPWEKPDPSEKILGIYMAKRVNQEGGNGDPVLAGTLASITENVEMEDRLLALDIPDGAYSIFIVFLTRKRGEDATKDYLNPLVKEAAQVLIEEVYEPHFIHYKEEFGKTILGFFSDEPRFGNIKGTEGGIGREDMVLPWREGLETELGFESKYLPLLWVQAQGAESQVRFIYMDVITRLYRENFTKVLGDWCRDHGVWYLGHTIEDNGAHARLGYGTGHYFRGQQDMDMSGIDVIGTQIVPGMNYHHDAFCAGGCNGEFFHYALAKLGSSAAHLDPRKQGRTMCEAFGAYGWNEGLKTMKWIADHLMVRGINYIVPHAFNPKEFPDFDCPPHFYAHGHNPQFRYFHVFSDYINRVMSLFRDGMQPAKVGVLYPAELEWAGAYMPVEKPARELTTHQISFDIIPCDYLKKARIGSHCYSINSVSFEVLVIPFGVCIPVDLLAVLEQMQKNGIEILFLEKKPDTVVGTADIGLDAKLFSAQRRMLENITAGCQVIPLKKLGYFLKEYQAVQLEKEQPDLVIGEYLKNQRKYYMFFNENIGHSVHTMMEFKEVEYVYRYDAMKDILYKADKKEEGYELSLEPYESIIWIVSPKKLECETADDYIEEPEVNLKECGNMGIWSRVNLPKQWEVRFADSFTYPKWEKEVPMEAPGLVSDLKGWETVCGTICFSCELEIEEYVQAILDLGEVYETAEVFVNRASAGVKICKPYRFDLSGLLKRGKNTLAIEVTNTLGTAIRDGLSQYLPIEPFGIRKEVKLYVR